MLEARILRAPEGDGGGGGGSAMERAGDAAISALGENTPVSTPSEPQAPAPAETTTQETQAPAPAEDFSYEFEHEGQTHKLSKAEVNWLLQRGVELARLEEQVKTQPRPQAPTPQGQGQEPPEVAQLRQEMSAIKEKLATQEQQALQAEARSSATAALEGNETLKRMAGSDPMAKEFALGLVLFAKGTGRGRTYEDAAKFVEKNFSQMVNSEQKRWIGGKITASQSRVEGGGGGVPAGKPKPFKRANLWDGSIESAAEAALIRSMEEDR